MCVIKLLTFEVPAHDIMKTTTSQRHIKIIQTLKSIPIKDGRQKIICIFYESKWRVFAFLKRRYIFTAVRCLWPLRGQLISEVWRAPRINTSRGSLLKLMHALRYALQLARVPYCVPTSKLRQHTVSHEECRGIYWSLFSCSPYLYCKFGYSYHYCLSRFHTLQT